MLKWLAGGLFVATLVTGAEAQATCSYTYMFTSGQNAVATQVNQDLNDIVNCALPASGGTLTNGTFSGTTTLPGSGVITSTGNIGIGTTSPIGKLHVAADTSGVLIVSNAAGTGDILKISGNNAIDSNYPSMRSDGTNLVLNPKTGGALYLNYDVSGASTYLNVYGGNVGIGTTSPGYLLTVNGTAYASGAAGALSDRRHKTDIAPFDADALDIVARLKPVTFVWKEPKDDGMRGRQIGFIAQDVETVIPDVVLTMNDATKTLGLKYDSLIPVLTKALQQQQAQVAQLTSMVLKLQAANDSLQKRVDGMGGNGGSEKMRRAAR